MADNRPIGIFDSGLGGLTVIRQLSKVLPKEDLIYLGDTARVPYGTRSRDTILKFSFEDAQFLLEKNVKLIIVACNTVSSVAALDLKRKIKIPIFDVIGPTLRYVNKKFGKKNVGVIGTNATIASGAYDVGLGIACPLIVPFIEEGEINSKALRLVVRKYLNNFKNSNIKALILGCTHYPIIEKMIQEEIGNRVKLINPEKLVSLEVKRYLVEHKLLTSRARSGKRTYFVTDLTDRFKNVAEIFLGYSISRNLKKVIID